MMNSSRSIYYLMLLVALSWGACNKWFSEKKTTVENTNEEPEPIIPSQEQETEVDKLSKASSDLAGKLRLKFETVEKPDLSKDELVEALSLFKTLQVFYFQKKKSEIKTDNDITSCYQDGYSGNKTLAYIKGGVSLTSDHNTSECVKLTNKPNIVLSDVDTSFAYGTTILCDQADEAKMKEIDTSLVSIETGLDQKIQSVCAGSQVSLHRLSGFFEKVTSTNTETEETVVTKEENLYFEELHNGNSNVCLYPLVAGQLMSCKKNIYYSKNTSETVKEETKINKNAYQLDIEFINAEIPPDGDYYESGTASIKLANWIGTVSFSADDIIFSCSNSNNPEETLEKKNSELGESDK